MNRDAAVAVVVPNPAKLELALGVAVSGTVGAVVVLVPDSEHVGPQLIWSPVAVTESVTVSLPVPASGALTPPAPAMSSDADLTPYESGLDWTVTEQLLPAAMI